MDLFHVLENCWKYHPTRNGCMTEELAATYFLKTTSQATLNNAFPMVRRSGKPRGRWDTMLRAQ
eukprot:3888780-Amphidinium_carterae.1